ncbi:MAG: MOSC N-terminal beta barrel domain-containing protein [Oscillatoria sp. PMC 1051.18]|nr:MOSC N-terminal beta barrel domain-containing protein [Oscillatoria sp. PMC 1050.18]MEC5030717.1 MOSC N-terminal beta barrel domain-containing protein [Oscillatoria sp. PMC 1051.18]
MRVTGVFVYPIKSCRGIRVDSAEVTAKGFVGDREFMIVDEQGKFVTQRKYPRLATIEVKVAENELILSADGVNLDCLRFQPSLSGREIRVEIWRDRTTAIDQGDKVAKWFQAALNVSQDFRLVRQSPRYLRPISPQFATAENQPVSFADGYPFLLIGTASLTDLNNKLAAKYEDGFQALPMNRFRPNLVVETDEAFVEDKWKVIQVGKIKFSVVKPCSRCVITTTNQVTGERNKLKEPLLTLSSYRQFSGGIMFGQNVIPEQIGIVNLGDEVQVLQVC